MATNDTTTRTSGQMAVGGVVGAVALAAGIAGTLFLSGGNVVNDTTTNPNPSLIAASTTANVPYLTFASATATATGGLASGGALGNYQAITITSPFAADAANRGLPTGTGTIRAIQLDFVAPQSTNKVTCSIAASTVRGTGGTLITNLNGKTMGTGSVVIYSTGSLILGPTQTFRCSTNPAPSASLDIRAKLWMTFSEVPN